MYVEVRRGYEWAYRQLPRARVGFSCVPISLWIYSDDEFDETLEQLQHIINKRPNCKKLIMGEDFNANIRVDEDNDNNGNTGAFGNSRQNDRGETLITFVVTNNLCSTTIFFKKNNYDMDSIFI